ncbi:conjugative transposon protein TraN [Flavobacterium xinjiangense]|uniref:Bacteroides conjugative transposon TraN protein n=1 Tax=Flavobacterium xinjiangense TaxID=178356 RepID=A0A1M7PB32_9FLAO|nr:conjugative transposon protein TraN [Flavobacterium xinjiangense]SHN13991.1 Bacteroides conjugative transposon TraN protein [Flavobacterium xinjiangense]
MKNLKTMVMVYTVFFTISAFAQQAKTNRLTKIESDSVSIGYSKTTNIVFPYAIKSVDRGSQDILVQKAKGLENILQIKAAQRGFIQTNLTVVTADGKLYSFVLNYNEQSSQLNLSVNKTELVERQEIYFSDESGNKEEIQEYSKLAFYEKSKIRGGKENRHQIKFQLNGIFIQNDIMYFRLIVENSSKIKYDIDQLRFFIRDSKRVKRTATQEIEITPTYILNDVAAVEGEAENTFVFALSKFTIPEDKYLAIQLMEKNGGRHLELDVKNKKIEKVKVLPTL